MFLALSSFLMFINDVCCAVNNSVFTKLFAGDIKIYTDVNVNSASFDLQVSHLPVSLG